MENTHAMPSGKTCRERFLAIKDETSSSSCGRLSKPQEGTILMCLNLREKADQTDLLGETPAASWERAIRLPGECWTPNTGESPKDAVESSLSAILQEDVPEKYSLSARACEGILRRAMRRVVVTGVRWAESGNRKNNQGLVTFTTASKELNNAADLSGAESNRTSKGGMILNTDNDESRRMVEMCYRTHKTLVNPIIDWTNEDVWQFIRHYNVPYCELYDCGFKRLGCVACPLGGSASMQRELEFFPQFRRFYVRTFDEMLDARRKAGKPIDRRWTDGESVLRWWVGKSGKSKYELQLGIFDETEEMTDEM